MKCSTRRLTLCILTATLSLIHGANLRAELKQFAFSGSEWFTNQDLIPELYLGSTGLGPLPTIPGEPGYQEHPIGGGGGGHGAFDFRGTFIYDDGAPNGGTATSPNYFTFGALTLQLAPHWSFSWPASGGQQVHGGPLGIGGGFYLYFDQLGATGPIATANNDTLESMRLEVDVPSGAATSLHDFDPTTFTDAFLKLTIFGQSYWPGASGASLEAPIWLHIDSIAAVPEPGSIALAAAGLIPLAIVCYRRRCEHRQTRPTEAARGEVSTQTGCGC